MSGVFDVFPTDPIRPMAVEGLAGVLTERAAGEVMVVVEIVLVRIGGLGVLVKAVVLVLRGLAGVEAVEVTRLRGGVTAIVGFVGLTPKAFFSADSAAGPRRAGVLLTSC